MQHVQVQPFNLQLLLPVPALNTDLPSLNRVGWPLDGAENPE